MRSFTVTVVVYKHLPNSNTRTWHRNGRAETREFLPLLTIIPLCLHKGKKRIFFFTFFCCLTRGNKMWQAIYGTISSFDNLNNYLAGSLHSCDTEPPARDFKEERNRQTLQWHQKRVLQYIAVLSQTTLQS